MALSAPAAARTAAAFLLLFLLPSAAAQVPDLPDTTEPDRAAVSFAVVTPQAFVEVGYNSNAITNILLMDLSRDSGRLSEVPGGGPSASATPHSFQLRIAQMRPEGVEGWQVLIGAPYVTTIGGETAEVPIMFQTTPLINSDSAAVDIEVTYTGPNNIVKNTTVTLASQVNPYDIALVLMDPLTQVQRVGQDEVARYQVVIKNEGVFPDTYQISASTDKSQFHVVGSPNVYVPPKSERTANISVLTPRGKFYEFGQNALLNVQVTSLSGGGKYTTVGIVQVRGFYIPIYWVPLLAVALVSAVVVTRAGSERSALRRKGRGAPRRVHLTPRQEILLADLKRTDPEAYEARKAQLLGVYKARRTKYRSERKQRAAAEREEHKQARVEMKEEQKRLKAQEKLEASERDAAKRAEKAQAKLDRKQAKVDAKENKKQAKVLGKQRKKLEKQKGKLEKKAAKVAAKEAKQQAKADKAAAKAAAREERAARKAQKARDRQP